MKKIFKVIGIIISFFVILYLIAFCTGRFGWRLFGFDMCQRPETLLVETVYVTNEKVHIVGHVANSATSYVGHTYEIKDNVLYVGIKQNLLFGFTERDGGYSIVIEEDFKTLDSIFLVGGDEQKCIWTAEEDKINMEKIKNIRLYKTVSTSSDNDYMEEMKNAEFEYADEPLLKRIQQSTYTDELYISKGAGYLAVAELEHGGELYLAMDRHWDFFRVIGKTGNYDY